MRLPNLSRALPTVAGAAGLVLALSTPVSAASLSPYLAGYAAGPATPPPATASVRFVVPTISCTLGPGTAVVGDAVIDYPVTLRNGATWGGVVLACTAQPTKPPVPSYTAEGFQWTSGLGPANVSLFSVLPGDVVVVTAHANSVRVHDVTSGKAKTATFAASVGVGQADVGFFCPADWFPGLGPCTAVPKFSKVKFSHATVNGAALGTSKPTASTLSGPGFSVRPSTLSKTGGFFTDTFH
jgi:hypothetical protein